MLAKVTRLPSAVQGKTKRALEAHNPSPSKRSNATTKSEGSFSSTTILYRMVDRGKAQQIVKG